MSIQPQGTLLFGICLAVTELGTGTERFVVFAPTFEQLAFLQTRFFSHKLQTLNLLKVF